MNTIKRPIYYWVTLIVCIGLFGYSFIISRQSLAVPSSTCLWHSLTGIACPACGGSHTLQALIAGQFLKAWSYNILVLGIYVLAMFCFGLILIDLLFQYDYFQKFYILFKNKLKNKYNSILLACLILLLWVHTIFKYF